MRRSYEGSGNPKWNGGRHVDHQGYVHVWAPQHPRAVRNKVREHRLVMERHIGRFLDAGEIVHHINGDKADNRIENLALFGSNSEHVSTHTDQCVANLPRPVSVTCSRCGRHFTTNPCRSRDICKRCRDDTRHHARKCEHCGSVFQPKKKRSRFCNRKCSARSRSDR